MNKLNNRKYFISLFSGCGGLDLGLSRAGFHAIFANDNDDNCVQSFKENFPRVPIFTKSVKDLNYEYINQIANGSLGQVDLIAGGPPCPPYSKSRFYRKEKPRALEDPIGNETLSGYLRILEEIRPSAFIFENVAGFAYKIHRKALHLLLEKAEMLGYICNWKVINAADYGVPQKRERFLLVGMKTKKFEFPEKTNTNDNNLDLFSNNIKPWVTAGEVLSDLDTEVNADDNGHFAGGQYHNLLKQVPPGDNYLYFTKERGHPNPIFKWRSRYWSFLLKLSPKLPSWTIQARRSNNMGPFHWRNRILRINEIKRLQTFPDDWYLAGSVEQKWRQVGNAVPPKLAEAMGKAIFEQLEE